MSSGAGGDTNVELAVRWNEAGGDVPAKTVAGLKAIQGAAAHAAPEIGDRMANAFARLEAREPTMVLRRARFAVEELAASAIGLQGPLGRLGASFALLGGETALGVVGGLAIVGTEVKELIQSGDQLDAVLVRLDHSFAHLGGAAASGFAQVDELRAREPEQPGAFHRLWARLGNVGDQLFTGAEHGDEQTAIQENMAAQQAAFDNAGNLVMAQVHKAHADARRRRDEQQQRQAEQGRREELQRIGLEEPSQAIHDLVANRARFQAAGASAGEEWAKAFIAAVNAGGGLTHRIGFQQGLLGGGTRYDLRGPGAAFRAGEAPTFAPFGYTPEGVRTGMSFADIDKGANRRTEGKEDDKGNATAERNAARMADAIGREIGPMIAMMAGMHGGEGRAVAGLGGVASTLGSLHNKAGGALLGAASPYLSLAGGVLSGVSMLFGGGHKPQIIISSYEQEALTQMKELRGEPLTREIIIIGPADMRKVQQALGRLGRQDSFNRLP